MSLRPIDLQTLFMRQTELSREQAALHDGMVQKKATELLESAEETLEIQEKVNRSTEIPDGPGEVKTDPDANREAETKGKGKRKPGGENGKNEPAAADEASEVVKDPNLGRNIDISG